MDNSGLLRVALRLNAAFSGLSGLVLILLPEQMGLLLGFSSPAVFLVVGVGLLGFSADLIHQATREKMAGWRALYASLGDVLWVLGSVVGVLVWADYLSAAGVAIVLAVAALVLCFGIAQLAGLNKLMKAKALSGDTNPESTNPTETALSDKLQKGDRSALVMQKNANNE